MGMPGRTAAILGGLVAAALVLLPGVAQAAPGGGADVGYDVSHPQCETPLPTDHDFGVVGVNGGVATTVNPCLAEQLPWAQRATGDVDGHPALQVYVNTANPGQVQDQISTWPRSGTSPYGECTGVVGLACSYVYGQTRASVDIHGFLLPTAALAGVPIVPAELRWWLDVETMNTWQTGSVAAQAANRATLEGMADYLGSTGAQVGLYSTGQQWRQIVGRVPTDSPLYDLDSWLAGAQSRTEAAEHCTDPALTGGGDVVLSQYVVEVDGRLLDHDLPC